MNSYCHNHIALVIVVLDLPIVSPQKQTTKKIVHDTRKNMSTSLVNQQYFFQKRKELVHWDILKWGKNQFFACLKKILSRDGAE